MLTWSLGCTGFFEPISPPSISMARFEITSLAFMFDCVPEPVCQTTSGKCSSSLPSITSCAAVDDGLAELRVEPAERHVGLGRRALDDAERAHDRQRLLLPADLEVAERALRPARPSSCRRRPRSGRRCRSRCGWASSWRALERSCGGSGWKFPIHAAIARSPRQHHSSAPPRRPGTPRRQLAKRRGSRGAPKGRHSIGRTGLSGKMSRHAHLGGLARGVLLEAEGCGHGRRKDACSLVPRRAVSSPG